MPQAIAAIISPRNNCGVNSSVIES